MKRKILSISLVLTMLCATVTLFAHNDDSAQFGWAIDSVKFCESRNILQGDENGNYNLGNNLTKSEMAKMISNGFALPQKQNAPRFSDINSSQWAYQYILNIQEYIVDSSGIYDPFRYATRAEFFSAVMFTTGKNCTNVDTINLAQFSDNSSIPDLYKQSLSAAVHCGYIKGDNGMIRANDNLTRAEACVFLHRILSDTKDHIIPEPANIPDSILNQFIPAPTPVPTAAPANPTPELTYPESQTPILAPAEHTVEEAQAWARSRGAHQRFIDIAPLYWYYGEIFGIRADVMYAQAAKETAFGKYTGRVTPEMNNWAGIKKYGAVGDETDDHETFATPEDGVRGHFNHMSAYVGVDPVGETHGRYSSVKSLAWAGTVKYVEDLGGKWCPTPSYGYSILHDYVYGM